MTLLMVIYPQDLKYKCDVSMLLSMHINVCYETVVGKHPR